MIRKLRPYVHASTVSQQISALSTHDFSHVRRRRLRVVFSSCLLAQGYLVTVFVVQPDNEVSVAGGNDGLL